MLLNWQGPGQLLVLSDESERASSKQSWFNLKSCKVLSCFTSLSNQLPQVCHDCNLITTLLMDAGGVIRHCSMQLPRGMDLWWSCSRSMALVSGEIQAFCHPVPDCKVDNMCHWRVANAAKCSRMQSSPVLQDCSVGQETRPLFCTITGLWSCCKVLFGMPRITRGELFANRIRTHILEKSCPSHAVKGGKQLKAQKARPEGWSTEQKMLPSADIQHSQYVWSSANADTSCLHSQNFAG